MQNLSTQQLDSLALELDQLRATTMEKVGEADARYIRHIIRLQRVCEILGRISLVLFFISPWFWAAGLVLLSLAKILDNMEIGHNVLHGQYDWMNDPLIHSRKYEWDIACDAQSWKRTHNYEHHTYTNIIGKDRDFGYGLLRMSNDFRWRIKNIWQLYTYAMLSLLFEWGIAYHELAAERVFMGKKNPKRRSKISASQLKRAFFRKGIRQILKDYVLFPLLAGPMWLPVLLGNWGANIVRNLWTSTIIFCGHFTKDVHTFDAKDCENESRGHWYLRQMLGSSNLTGPRWFHILTGHLSCQIEHHLFPDVPARHYPNMAIEVEQIAKRYNIPYNNASFARQYASVLWRVARYSLPVRNGTQVTHLTNST